MEMKRRAYSRLEVKDVNEDRRIIRGIATTPGTDRVGDIIEPLGVKFKNPLVFLWQHNHTQPIGTVRFEKPTEDGIRFEAEIPVISEAGLLKDRVDEAWQSIKLGLVRAVSIGFRAIEYSFMDNGGIRFSQCEVFELSAVTIPANADAVITGIGKSMDAATIAALKQFDINHDAANGKKTVDISPGASGHRKNKINLKPKEKTMAVKIGERIEALENTIMEKAARMEAILQTPGDEGRTTDAAEQEEFDSLNDELKAIDADLERYRTLERTQAAEAKPVNSVKPSVTLPAQAKNNVVKVKGELEPGIGFARYAMVLAASKGNIFSAKAIAEKHFPNDHVLKTVMKSAVEAGTTTKPEWAGALVEYSTLATDFIEFLRPRTIIGRFGTDNIPALRRIPFNVHIKGQTASGSAAWVGEGYAKPVTKAGFNDVYLGWAKVSAISVITEELIRFSDPSAEMMVRDDLANAAIERIDMDFIDPAKAAGQGATASPSSITNGITPIASTGNDAESIRRDIGNLWAVADSTNMPVTGAVYITDSKTARGLSLMRNALGNAEFPGISVLGGTFEGVPVIVSNYVPATSDGSLFILAFAPEIFLADDGTVTLDASREASIQMDTAPDHNSGSPKSAELVSMYQTNSVALRAERYINWARRRQQAVAYLKGVKWGVAVPPGS